MPPYDPTVAPSVTLRVSETVRVAPRPILASECLREDLAPHEPFPRATRIALGASGLVMMGAAAMIAPTSIARAVLLAVAAGLAGGAVLAKEYASRGRIAALAALGCLAVPSFAAPAAIALATALFVRASYRAHRGTRIALAVAIATFVVAAALSFGATHVGAAVMLAAAVVSLLGFMGEQTTGGCAVWAGFAVCAATTTVVLSAPLSLASIGVGLATLAVTTACSVAGYLLSASRIAPSRSAAASNDA